MLDHTVTSRLDVWTLPGAAQCSSGRLHVGAQPSAQYFAVRHGVCAVGALMYCRDGDGPIRTDDMGALIGIAACEFRWRPDTSLIGRIHGRRGVPGLVQRASHAWGDPRYAPEWPRAR